MGESQSNEQNNVYFNIQNIKKNCVIISISKGRINHCKWQKLLFQIKWKTQFKPTDVWICGGSDDGWWRIPARV